MKKLIAIVCVVISVNSFCQINSDSLAKYSYSVYGFTPPTYSFFGSGFFIKRNNLLYFISAAHVFDGCLDGKKLNHFPKYMNIIITNKSNQSIQINTKNTQNPNGCFPSKYNFDTDFIVIKIDTNWLSCVNSVESLIHPAIQVEDSVRIFGYPRWSYGYDFLFKLGNLPTNMNLPKENKGFYNRLDSVSGTLDLMSVMVEFNHFMKDYDSLAGFSGSPVFLLNKKTKQWRVAGIFTGGGSNPDGRCAIYYTYIELAIKKIDEEFNTSHQ